MNKNKIVILASGSKGNMYFLMLDGIKILVDFGLSYQQAKKRLNEVDIDIMSIDLLLITHEHIDHVKGLNTFIKNNQNTKIVMTTKTQQSLNCNFDYIPVLEKVQLKFKTIIIKPYPISHDATHPVNYIIETENKKIVFIYDTGYIHQNLETIFKNYDILILEANHDVQMVMENPKYPFYLKQRIISEIGHLSNDQAISIANNITHQTKEQKIILAHISEHNNFAEEQIKIHFETEIKHANTKIITPTKYLNKEISI